MANEIMRVRSWTRIEPHARNTDMSTTLAAEIADPLWLLARQWQLGELTGSDGGSPVLADVSASWSRLTRLRADGTTGDARVVEIDGNTPLEALVEGERELVGTGAWGPRLRAGRDLASALRSAGLPEAAAALATGAATAFTDQPAPEDAPGDTDDCYAVLTAGRALIDGGKVADLLRDGGQLRAGLPAEVLAGLADDQLQALDDVGAAWLGRAASRWGIAATTAGRSSSAWRQDRLDYAFTLAAPPLPGTEDPLVLEATDYDGAGLAWHSLDLAPVPEAFADLVAGDGEVGTRISTVLPATVTFPGAAADRYWEFEDAAVSFGATAPASTDLVAMLAVEFGVAYSPDWLLLPVELPLGAVACVDWVVVRDTFGVATLLGDRTSQAADGHGRVFQPDDLAPGAQGDHPLLVLLHSALGQQVSAERESVHLRRDELANLAWAIERVVTGRAGGGTKRQYSSADFALPDPAPVEEPAELTYRLATRVPGAWIPLVAQSSGALRKGRILDTPTATTVASTSQLLAELQEIPGHVITGVGSDVVTTDQMCRTADGARHVWRGRTRLAGPGEVTSGLAFDVTQRRR